MIRLLIVAICAALPAAAAEFPAISDTERALARIEGYPDCPAVMLFRHGSLELEPDGQGSASILTVAGRLKILTEEGKRYGEIALDGAAHRPATILDLAGRTVLADGRALELDGKQALAGVSAQHGGRTISMPETPFSDSRRNISLQLALTEGGSITGRGSLELSGHQAWRVMRRETAGELVSHWQSWLAEQLPGFAVSEIEVDEEADEQRVRIGWRMERQESASGTEVDLLPGRLLPGAELPLQGARVTPVLLPFTSRDELELSLSWPRGWTVGTTPEPWECRGFAGEDVAGVEVDSTGRSLYYTRRLDLQQREFTEPEQLEDLLRLLRESHRHAAQQLVLTRQ